jgi:hypothetical protein
LSTRSEGRSCSFSRLHGEKNDQDRIFGRQQDRIFGRQLAVKDEKHDQHGIFGHLLALNAGLVRFVAENSVLIVFLTAEARNQITERLSCFHGEKNKQDGIFCHNIT